MSMKCRKNSDLYDGYSCFFRKNCLFHKKQALKINSAIINIQVHRYKFGDGGYDEY